MKRLVYLLLALAVLLAGAATAEKGGTALSGTRGSFQVTDSKKSVGKQSVTAEVVVDESAEGVYWIVVKSPVTKFKVEALTWDDKTFTVKKAKTLYSAKKLAKNSVIAIRDWLPEMLPTVRFRAVSQDGTEEIWYVGTNEENGSVILFSEAEMTGVTEISEANFPDTAFRKYVSQFDKDKDGCLSQAEKDAVDCIDVSESKISDLTGVEHFTSVTMLICYGNKLTSLDLSRNTRLTDVDCQDNRLTKLDVSGCSELVSLICNNNKLKKLDVSGKEKLTLLWCGNNQLASLDVTGNYVLNSLNCEGNQLKKLDVTWNSDLDALVCGGNQLKSLDLSYNKELSSLDCKNNQLTELNLLYNKALYSLDCSNNKLASLSLFSDALVYLDCSGNKLKKLDITKCDILNALVQEVTPGTDEEGRYGWLKKYDWGVPEKYLFADKSVQIATRALYTPAFGMTMDEMISLYNTAQPSSGKYGKLDTAPQQWTSFQDYQVAWFCPDSGSSMIFLLMSRNPSALQATSTGLDRIDISVKDPDDVDFLFSVAERCAYLLVAEPDPANPASDLYQYYYANGLDRQGLSVYRPLAAGSPYTISYTYYASSGEYYFSIYTK